MPEKVRRALFWTDQKSHLFRLRRNSNPPLQVATELFPPPFPGPGTFIPPGLGGGAETPREGGAEGEARSVRGRGASLFTPREGGAEIPPGEVGTGEGGGRQLRRNLSKFFRWSPDKCFPRGAK